MAVDFNVDAALAKLGDLVQQHGPDAVNLAAEVVRVNAVGELVGGLVCALFSAGLAWGATKIAPRTAWAWGEGILEEGSSPIAVGGAVYLMAGGVVAALLLVVSGFKLLDVWNWVALFNPKLALAHEVLTKLTAVAQ